VYAAPVKRISYMHSFSVTPRFAIFFEYPVYYSFVCIVTGKPIHTCFEPDEHANTTVRIVSLDGSGTAVTLETEGIFSMHHINAFEASPTEIIVDMNVITSVKEVFSALDLDQLRNRTKRDAVPMPASSFRRYSLDLSTGTISYTEARLTDAAGAPYAIGAGLPRINYERFNGRRACFAYAECMSHAAGSPHYASQALIKVDMCGGEPLLVWRKEGHYISEPVFVARPGGHEEDDGVLVAATLDGAARRSYVLVLDAKTMTEVARVDNPEEFVVPFSLHGQFYAA